MGCSPESKLLIKQSTNPSCCLYDVKNHKYWDPYHIVQNHITQKLPFDMKNIYQQKNTHNKSSSENNSDSDKDTKSLTKNNYSDSDKSTKSITKNMQTQHTAIV